MSYDLYLLSPGVARPREVPAFDEETDNHTLFTPEQLARRERLLRAMAEKLPEWNPGIPPDHARSAGATLEWTLKRTGVQFCLDGDEGAISLPDGDGRDSDELWMDLERLLAVIRDTTDFALYDGQSDRTVSWTGGLGELRKGYRDYLQTVAQARAASSIPPRHAPPLFPETLDRLPYLTRWLILTGTGTLLFFAVMALTLHTAYEPLVLVPAAGWLVAKVFLLDPARLRDIGWSPLLSITGFVPPLNLFFQLLLFVLPSRRVSPFGSAITVRKGK